MPTNLTSEAKAWLARYQAARKVEERIAALEKALSHIPKHKGTEKLRAQMKRRLSHLRREAEEKRLRKRGSRKGFSVGKEGAAQITLIGAANSGKSLLMKALTNARPEVADYPLTTTRPVPGMLNFDGVELQLIEAPAIMMPNGKETPFLSRSLGLAKNADAVIIVLDAAANAIDQLKQIQEYMEDAGILLKEKKSDVRIEKTSSGGIRLTVFDSFDGTLKDVREILEGVRIHHAVVKVYGEASVSDVEETLVRDTTHKKGVVVLNKMDAADEVETRRVLSLGASLDLPIITVSAKTSRGLGELKTNLFSTLRLIRVYTRKSGEVSDKPIVVPEGSKVQDIAAVIHKEFQTKFRYAKVWGSSVKIPGQRVGRMHVLKDNDLVELHVK